ncbi:hypothetical protein EGW08_013186 [Elysia chlorotica]|uniref:Uncharacterized protein n=1 Tax=Elysia chlorotica TaxID=188477 RepID=A0A3S0ZJA9_ELYCH|nr:hypothetical protein EGW08_013186 [Elysia chlorotica]
MASMLISWHKCCILGVISLFFMQCACVSGQEEAERLLKESYWEPAEDDSLVASNWNDLNVDDEVLQPEGQRYSTEDLDQPKAEEDDYVMEPVPEAGAQAYRTLMEMLRGSARAGRMQDLSLRESFTKRGHGPRGFYASRGKRFVPGMEALLLARYYEAIQKHAKKFKRQPHPGFHGSRG